MASATARCSARPSYGEACAEGGTQLSIVKTAPPACVPGGDCTFGVTITNTGSLPFSGDVVLSDSMFMGAGVPLPAPITAIVPPLGCAPAPGALPFSCTAPLSLAAGAALKFDITAKMPDGRAARILGAQLHRGLGAGRRAARATACRAGRLPT